jgi:hypothetical protein
MENLSNAASITLAKVETELDISLQETRYYSALALKLFIKSLNTITINSDHTVELHIDKIIHHVGYNQCQKFRDAMEHLMRFIFEIDLKKPLYDTGLRICSHDYKITITMKKEMIQTMKMDNPETLLRDLYAFTNTRQALVL